METYCRRLPANRQYLDSRVPVISQRKHFFFCPVTKSASTFWSRFVLKLDASGTRMESPFKVPRLNNSLVFTETKLSAIGNRQDRFRFLRKSIKTVFVRDPYHRMFSAYVDKVFAPNPTFWGQWGRRLPSKLRVQRYGSKRLCLHDLTFAEVLSTAAAFLYKYDLHFIPVVWRCIPCQFKYDVVGKMETFAEDLRYLSNHMNLSLTEYFASDEFRYDYAKDAIEDSIYSPFGWLKDIFRCMDKLEMGLRIWRKLQIRGIIDRRIAFPYPKEKFLNVTAEQFIHDSLKAHLRSTDREELERQKREAFVEAYRTVDMSVLQKMKTVFKADFEMFVYESEPADVFDRNISVTVTGAFDWLNPWTG